MGAEAIGAQAMKTPLFRKPPPFRRLIAKRDEREVPEPR